MKKDISWGISGNKERIFVSVAWGCQYNCKYCYLQDFGIYGIKQFFGKDELLLELERRKIFIPGKKGSLVTIGCFTECWNEINRKTTIDIINFFLKQGNYVQISTKKKIHDEEIASIADNVQFENQMNIFVSLPTISYANIFEPDVDCPNLRIENLDIKQKYGINTYLYIKPVLENITIKDKEKYVELIKKYQIPVVVGELLHPASKKEKGFFLGNAYMQEHPSDDSEELSEFFEKYTKVYKHSDEIINHLRKMDC